VRPLILEAASAPDNPSRGCGRPAGSRGRSTALRLGPSQGNAGRARGRGGPPAGNRRRAPAEARSGLDAQHLAPGTRRSAPGNPGQARRATEASHASGPGRDRSTAGPDHPPRRHKRHPPVVATWRRAPAIALATIWTRRVVCAVQQSLGPDSSIQGVYTPILCPFRAFCRFRPYHPAPCSVSAAPGRRRRRQRRRITSLLAAWRIAAVSLKSGAGADGTLGR
jgi:hypothetical protein